MSVGQYQTMHFHVTLRRNLDVLLRDGFEPQIGPRAKMAQEPVPAVYFFTSREAADEALTNWLGDLFQDDDELVVLHVDLDALELPADVYVRDVPWEAAVRLPVPRSVIVLVEDEQGQVLYRQDPAVAVARQRARSASRMSLTQLAAVFADYDGPEVSGKA